MVRKIIIMDARKGDWYEKEIGKVYDLLQEVKDGYRVSKKKKGGFINKKDCGEI